MTDPRNKKEVKIEVLEIAFEKKGQIYFKGLVDGIELEDMVNSSCKDFDKFLPKEPADYKYIDDDGLLNGVMDKFHNLHWFILISGNIFHRVIYLDPIIRDELYELYCSIQYDPD